MIKPKRLLAMLLTLCMILCLAACGGGKEGKRADVGYYTLTAMSEGSDSYDLDTLASFGTDTWYIDLQADHTGTLYLGEDDTEELTWVPGTITSNGDSVNYTLEGDTLTLAGDSYEMVFTRSVGTPPAAVPAAPAASGADSGNTEPSGSADGTLLETGYFTLTYGGDWICDPEEVDDYEDSSAANLEIPDPEKDRSLVYIRIVVNVNTPFDFATTMFRNGMNFYDAVNEDAYETVPIGGMNFWRDETTYTVWYYGYDETSNTFVTIYVSDKEYIEQAQEVIDTLQFTRPAYTGDAIPLYWEGEPYAAEPHSTNVSGFTVTTKQLANDLAYPTYNFAQSRAASDGEYYYVLNDGSLEVYTRSGDALAYQGDWALPFEPNEFFLESNGIPCISAFTKDLTRLDSETGTVIAEDTDYVAAHPSAAWGISYFSSGEIAKVDFTTGTSETLTLPGVATLSSLTITENYILASVILDDANRTPCLKIYDFNFNEVGGLDENGTTTGCYGSVSTAAETANGLIVFDGNMRDVYFLDNSLTLIETVDMDVLFGTDYPWPCSAVTMDDGSVLLCLTDHRADDSADETVLFEISGF